MLAQHSASSIIHRIARDEAGERGNVLAMVARARGDVLQTLALETTKAPDREMRAAQMLVDKRA